MVKFVVATITDFETVGIDVSACRTSVDGTKALKHIENLSATELNSIRLNENFLFIGDEDIYALMETDEWKSEDTSEEEIV